MSKWFRKYYKCLKTRNEARQNQGDEFRQKNNWCRAKRRPPHLANAWDDRLRGHQKNWKKFRKTKYRFGHRGQKHILFIEDWKQAWALQEYCEAHDIPFNMEEVRIIGGTGLAPIRKAKVIGQKPYYHYKYTTTKDENGNRVTTKVKTIWFYVNEWEWYTVGYKKVTYYHTKGYTCTWWSDKDIGVEYILQSKNY